MSDHVVALLFVRLYKGQKRMDVAVDYKGSKRLVKYKWATKEDTDVPPDNWFDMAVQELRFTDAEKKRGMIGGF